MKKKFLALIVCVSLALVGCGSAASNNAAAEAPKETTATKTETVKEEPKAPEKVETKTEEKQADKATETKKTEEKTEESKAEASTEASTEVQEKTEEVAETAPAEEVVTQEVAQNTEPTYATVIEKYIADGSFTDYFAYGDEMGATGITFPESEKNIIYYFDSYAITVGTNVQDPEYAYVGTVLNGNVQYACLVPYKNVPTVPVSSSGTFVPVDALIKLEQTINYMKAHPDATQKPDIPGMDWKSWAELVG